MLNEKPLVLTALETITAFKDIFISFPSDFTVLPCASYYEIFNAPNTSADDDEYLSEIVFIVDVWAKTSGETSTLAIETDKAMKQAGFRREFAADVNDTESTIRHKTMRFKLIK